MNEISVVGAGLAGCEVAWQLARFNLDVNLYEMKPKNFSKAHKSENFAELVCSNSFKSTKEGSAPLMLKKEMQLLNSLTLEVAEKEKVDAGDALAVDRERFSKELTKRILANEKINVIRKEIKEIPDGLVIFATGPLTSESLTKCILKKIGKEELYFFDAIAPIVYGNSINYEKAFFASRNDISSKDYLNCPMNKEEYLNFYENLINAKTANLHSFDKPKVFQGCMPIEIMAKRGQDTMRFGPLKPVGIVNPKTNEKYYSIVQLRKENLESSFFNIVGFQTNLTYSEQKRVFRLIPALENAEFLRYGTMHKNIFINSPSVLEKDLSLKEDGRIFFAGQITGVEGYLESAACGIAVGKILGERLKNNKEFKFPETSLIGSLMRYITNEENASNFQPMNANFGILPSLDEPIKGKKERHIKLSKRGVLDLEEALK